MGHMLSLELSCPVCHKTGPAQGIDGEHQGVWLCENENCPKEFFVDSNMQFYDHEQKEWTWDNVKERMT